MLYETITLYFTDNSLVSNRDYFSRLLLKEIANLYSAAAQQSIPTPQRRLFFLTGIQNGIIA